jgi:hypothetical protein
MATIARRVDVYKSHSRFLKAALESVASMRQQSLQSGPLSFQSSLFNLAQAARQSTRPPTYTIVGISTSKVQLLADRGGAIRIVLRCGGACQKTGYDRLGTSVFHLV